jgi:hypothetical protein
MCAESSSLCFSWGRRLPWTLLRLWMYSRSLLPFLACDAKPRRTSWWWRHVPFTPLCIKSSSSLQSKVGSNLNIVSFTLKNETESAYFKCKFFYLFTNCWCRIHCPIAGAIISILRNHFVSGWLILFYGQTIFFSLQHLKFFRFFSINFFRQFSIFIVTYLFLSIFNEFRFSFFIFLFFIFFGF